MLLPATSLSVPGTFTTTSSVFGGALVEPYVIGALVSVAVVIALLIGFKRWGRNANKSYGLLSDRVFEAFFGDASVGIAVIDEHGAIARTNDVFEDMTGYDQQSLLGKLYVDLVYDPSDASGRDRVVGALDRFGESHTLTICRRDGSFFRARFIVSPAPASLSRNQSVIFVEAVGPDRDRERELIDEYNDAVAEGSVHDQRTPSTFGVNTNPSSSMTDPGVGKFLAVLDDELVTPLTIIKGYLSLIDEPAAGIPNDIVAAIREGTDRLADKLESLIYYAKLQSGEVPIQSQSVDVPRVISEAIDYLRERTATTAEVRVIGPDRGVTITSDPVALQNIVVNLVDNAMKFGNGTDVEISVRHRDGQLALCVSNIAGGFDSALSTNVFDSFYQVSSGPARKHRGFGLGLSIVRDLVDRMGGDVSILTAEGSGTTVLVSVPAMASTPQLRRAA